MNSLLINNIFFPRKFYKKDSKDYIIDIDSDIEQKISQLQEGRLDGSIKPISNISIDPDKQLKQWNLEKGLESFLANIEIEKEDLGKKIAEEEKKISALEGLFSELTNKAKPKKKKELLVEPEKLKLKVEPNNKPIDPQPPVDISPIKEEKVILDPEARRLVLERYGQLNQGFPLPKEVESDPDIVNKVMSHINEMKVANELEKNCARYRGGIAQNTSIPHPRTCQNRPE